MTTPGGISAGPGMGMGMTMGVGSGLPGVGVGVGVPGGGSLGGAFTAAGMSGPVSLPGGVQLPNAGTGGAPSSNMSITFLVGLSIATGLAGLACAMLGRQRELENDGVSCVTVPVRWT